MDVFFETQNGLKFCIELGYWDTILEIKKKIKKYQRIPVPTQTLFFQGNNLQDHLDIEQCKILHKSRVTVLFSNDKVLQPKQPPIPSKAIGDIIYSDDLPLTTEDFENIQIYLPPEETEGIINGQDSLVMRNNDQSQPSDAGKQIINGNQESTVTVQTEESPASSSNSVKKNKNIQDSRKNVPMKRIAVRVLLPYSGAKNFSLFVNTTDHVRKLRTLVQNRVRDQSWLRDGYFFKYKERILYEDQSFEWNGVGRFNRIDIVPDPWLL